VQRDVTALTEGGVAGIFGTVLMSAVMFAGRKAGLLGSQPPEKLSERALHIAGIHHDKEGKQDVLAAVLHLGFGATMGSLFGLCYRRLKLPLSAPVQGMAFATGVWAVSYKGWIPALGILPPPERDRPGRPMVMVLAHWVYGWTLGGTLGATGHVLQSRASDEDDTVEA
jgi:hypothetical protein